MTGTPSDSRLGTRLTGREGLRATGNFALLTLKAQLERYIERFHDTAYQQRFPWIDNIREVKDDHLREELDNLLQERIDLKDWGSLWLAAPDIINWKRTAGFAYRFGRQRPIIYDMHLKSVAEHLAGAPLSVATLKKKYVQSLSIDDQELESWPLYRCLHAEIEHRSDTYLLSGGRWFQADTDFVARVNDAAHRVPIVDLRLPAFDDEIEDAYNRRVARTLSDRFALMHGDPIPYGGGRSSIEPCDLYSSSGEFIHIKRYSGSSDLSHLFAQGVIAGETFARDPGFREEVSRRLPESFRPPQIGRTLPANRFKVAFGVISRSGRELRLPFFARLNLKRAQEILVSLGYDVVLTDISVSDRLKFMKRSREVRKVF